MHPVLIKFGLFELRSWGVAFAITTIMGIYVAVKRAPRFGIGKNNVIDFSVIILLFALIGSRLWYIVFHLEEFRGHWLDTISPFHNGYFGIAGMSMVGGVLLAIIGAALFAWQKKLNFVKLGDVLAPSFLLGAGIQRVGGCFLNGCCFGKPTHSFLGIIFPPEGVAGSILPNTPLYPTQLFASALGFLGFALILWLEKWHKFNGYTLWIVLLYYSIDRFVVDQFRYYEQPQVIGHIGPLTFNVNEILLLILFLTSIILWLKGWSESHKMKEAIK